MNWKKVLALNWQLLINTIFAIAAACSFLLVEYKMDHQAMGLFLLKKSNKLFLYFLHKYPELKPLPTIKSNRTKSSFFYTFQIVHFIKRHLFSLLYKKSLLLLEFAGKCGTVWSGIEVR